MATARTKATTKASDAVASARAARERRESGEPKESRAATPWGAAVVVEQAAVPQRAGERRFSVVVQLLETRGGERLIRFAYTSDGSARRGPVTMRVRDLERLRAALERAPVLASVLESAVVDPGALVREAP